MACHTCVYHIFAQMVSLWFYFLIHLHLWRETHKSNRGGREITIVQYYDKLACHTGHFWQSHFELSPWLLAPAQWGLAGFLIFSPHPLGSHRTSLTSIPHPLGSRRTSLTSSPHPLGSRRTSLTSTTHSLVAVQKCMLELAKCSVRLDATMCLSTFEGYGTIISSVWLVFSFLKIGDTLASFQMWGSFPVTSDFWKITCSIGASSA